MKGKRVPKKEGKSRSTALANVSHRALVSVDALAMIPEEAVWLASRKSARTRRAYRTDVQHFMAYVGITSAEELRRVDHRAVMAWERQLREAEGCSRPRSGGVWPHSPVYLRIW